MVYHRECKFALAGPYPEMYVYGVSTRRFEGILGKDGDRKRFLVADQPRRQGTR